MIFIPVHVNLGSHVQKVVKELVKAPATNPPAKGIVNFEINSCSLNLNQAFPFSRSRSIYCQYRPDPLSASVMVTGAINSGSFCRIDPDMETW